ncbi:DUF3280 domain-containing protein [Pelagibius sp. 7325]|uniref:DUF3280 domain-containing protein n=1 Tax=Pelagibius sp. 7325 TaxID=3131994 RepID=UPI0030EDFA7B
MRFAVFPLLALLIALPAAASPGAAPVKVAVFDLELYDTSLEGEMRGKDPAETARLEELTALLREAVAHRDDMVAVDIGPLRERLARMPALYSCSGCEAKLAGELGAERSVSGFVYKISTLILYITIAVRDTATGKLIEEGSVSIRGNTDESWRHGMDSLLQRQIFKASME